MKGIGHGAGFMRRPAIGRTSYFTSLLFRFVRGVQLNTDSYFVSAAWQEVLSSSWYAGPMPGMAWSTSPVTWCEKDVMASATD